MIFKEDYKNLLEFFETHAIPDELTNFVEKLKLIYEELNYREEVQKKIEEIHNKLNELSQKEED